MLINSRLTWKLIENNSKISCLEIFFVVLFFIYFFPRKALWKSSIEIKIDFKESTISGALNNDSSSRRLLS